MLHTDLIDEDGLPQPFYEFKMTSPDLALVEDASDLPFSDNVSDRVSDVFQY